MYLDTIDFSVWLDFIERDYLRNDFQKLIDAGTINGATSNPAIFKQAFLSSAAYDEQKAGLAVKGKALYEALAMEDIRLAADMLRPLYDKGDDGFVSIEVDPNFCDDTAATIQEGMALYEAIGRPNVMIKVPATSAGYDAMRTLLSKGIHVNATLIFSLEQAKRVLEAVRSSRAPEGTKNVISIFVSRFDRLLDPTLPADMKGRTGIMNAAHIYNEIEGAKLPGVKALFASTGVKGDDYRPSYYVDELIGANAVNTAPVATIDAFVANGDKRPRLPLAQEEIDEFFIEMKIAGVDFHEVCDRLTGEGLDQFKTAFAQIMEAFEG